MKVRRFVNARCGFLATVVVFSCAGCGDRWNRRPVDFAKARCPAGYVPVASEANANEKVWTGGATVPIGKAGKARFVWDDKGIYCFLDNSKNSWWAPGRDESICVSFAAKQEQYRHVRLYFSAGLLPGQPVPTPRVPEVTSRPIIGGHEVRLAKTVAQSTSNPLFDLDPKLIRFESSCIYAKCGRPWKTWFFLSWKALSDKEAPPKSLFVHVFIISGVRPYSFLKMESKDQQHVN